MTKQISVLQNPGAVFKCVLAAMPAALALSAQAAVPPGALPNPERGFRFEKRIAALETKNRSGQYEWPLTEVERRYKAEDGVVMSQAYCYLTRYCDGEIPQTKLDALQTAFDEVRAEGVKLILRFAYENDIGRPPRVQGPTAERILSHIAQLTPVVRKNIDIIYTLQIGWVGAWGEFHSSIHGIEKDKEAVARITKATLDMLPESRCTMMRTMSHRENALSVLKEGGDRIGFFNDATLANQTDGGTWKTIWKGCEERQGRPGNPQFDEVCRIGVHVPVEGELFWRGADIDLERQGGLSAVIRFWRNHYSTFSIVHGNKDLDASSASSGKLGAGKFGAIDLWKITPVTKELLDVFGVPGDPAYFEGVPHRTAYEYIRDHLGYRLLATGCERKDCEVSVILRNCGFAAPINPRRVYFVVVSKDGTAKEIATDFDCRKAEPGKDVVVTAAVPVLRKGHERLALWLPDESESLRYRPEYAIRLAGGATVKEVGGRILNVLP